MRVGECASEACLLSIRTILSLVLLSFPLVGGCVLPGIPLGGGGGGAGGPNDTTVVDSWRIALGADAEPVQTGRVELPFTLRENGSEVAVELQLNTAAAVGFEVAGPGTCDWAADSPAAGTISRTLECGVLPAGAHVIALSQTAGATEGEVRVHATRGDGASSG